MIRRRIAAALVLSLGLFAGAHAQTYPDRLIKLIVPFTPGSPVDSLARVAAQHFSARLGQSIIIENRPGGGTTIGSKAVATAPADGYTLLAGGSTFAYFPALYPSLDFDPMKSFAPVATIVTWSHVMVITPNVPANTVAEFVAYAKANPGKLNFGFGLGTTPQIIGETFKLATGTDINSISYRGGAQAVADMLGDRIQLNFGTVATLLPLIQQGKLRPLAFTGVTRSQDLPNVPTMIESGLPQLAFNPDVWVGIMAPVGTPPAIVDKLNAEINAALKTPEMIAALTKLGFEPKTMSPQELATFMAEEMRRWPPIVTAAGLKAE